MKEEIILFADLFEKVNAGELLEAITIFCFGLSWPISIRKSYVSRTAKGKSLFFEVFLLIGYAVGITKKSLQLALPNMFAGGEGWCFYLAFFFYCFNFVAIAIDTGLYFRNSRLDREAHIRHEKKNAAIRERLERAERQNAENAQEKSEEAAAEN